MLPSRVPFHCFAILFAAILSQSPSANAITINGIPVGPGGIFPNGEPASAASLSAVGGGMLDPIFGVAATWWQQAIADPFSVDVYYGWSDLSATPGTLAVASPTVTGDWQIRFDSSGFYGLYLDPVPGDNIEYGARWNEEANLGAGTVNTARLHYKPLIPDAFSIDVLSIAKHEVGHVLGVTPSPPAPSPFTPIDPGLPFGGSVIPLADPSHFDIKLPPSMPPAPPAPTAFPRSLMGPFVNAGIRYGQSEIDILAVATANGWTQLNLSPHGAPGPAAGAPFAKWSQQPVNMKGENIASDFDWREIMRDPADRDPNGVPAVVAADDFQSDGRPIETVRWWGSYFGDNFPFPEEGLTSPELGFVVSFFSDTPDPDPNDPNTYSQPGQLLGTYYWPIEQVEITGTDLVGWDGHNVVKYEAKLSDAHLDHAIAGLSDPDAFREVAGDIYWISIAAWDGHIVQADWTSIDSGEPVRQVTTNPDGTVTEDRIWGWHTSPDDFNDVGVVGSLDMYNPPTDWDYGNWLPITPAHGLHDFAFELLTSVPEPSGIALAVLGLMALAPYLRRR